VLARSGGQIEIVGPIFESEAEDIFKEGEF
jgi:hypothetical protein